MHSLEIEFKDLDQNSVKETFWFNLSKAEVIKFNYTNGKKGLEELIKEIIATEDMNQVFGLFEQIVEMSYGVRDPLNNRRFIKSKELFLEFQQTDAYSELFLMLLTSPVKAAEFITATVPPEMAQNIANANDPETPTGPTVGTDAVLAKPLDLERAQATLASSQGAEPIFVVKDEVKPSEAVNYADLTPEAQMQLFREFQAQQNKQ